MHLVQHGSENPKFVTDKKSGKRKLRPQTSQPCNKLKCPSTAKVAKRRSSSITSELELQIEIEESTKRAKVRTNLYIDIFQQVK